MGLADGVADSIPVQRDETPKVNDLRAHTVGSQLFRGLQGEVDLAGPRKDGQIAALTTDIGAAQRDRCNIVRHLHLLRVEELVLQKYHGVIIADSGHEQALGVSRRRGAHQLQAGNMGKQRFHVLGMLRRAAASGAHGRADHHGDLDLSAGHIVQLCRLVHHGVQTDGDKVIVHQLDDGALAAHGRAHADAGEAPFADRGGDNAVGTVLVQQADTRAEGTAQLPDILAQNDHVFITEHFLVDRLADGSDHSSLTAHRTTLLSLSQA